MALPGGLGVAGFSTIPGSRIEDLCNLSVHLPLLFASEVVPLLLGPPPNCSGASLPEGSQALEEDPPSWFLKAASIAWAASLSPLSDLADPVGPWLLALGFLQPHRLHLGLVE